MTDSKNSCKMLQDLVDSDNLITASSNAQAKNRKLTKSKKLSIDNIRLIPSRKITNLLKLLIIDYYRKNTNLNAIDFGIQDFSKEVEIASRDSRV